MMGWTYVKVLLTSLNCHAATSGFHQGLWERQVSRTEWCSDAFNEQHSNTRFAFIAFYTLAQHGLLQMGAEILQVRLKGVWMERWTWEMGHTHMGERAEELPHRQGWEECAEGAAYSRGVGVCAGGNGARGRRLQHLRVHHHVKLTWNDDRSNR